MNILIVIKSCTMLNKSVIHFEPLFSSDDVDSSQILKLNPSHIGLLDHALEAALIFLYHLS